ncbi:hypothetical protein BDV26DRAFT_290430 [Aspergillus bertholletiae]|uniref:SH3 domain-containing protein n=1 Tax=Aspergillus bertholletiae TaxID=1226010 RepID=A0A5N7BEY3_9EURO|nr:hypothetical protein BDV26DRAFT_290430 [Aspergillus bertholletiae]
MRTVEALFDRDQVATPREYQPLASRVVQDPYGWQAPSVAPVANSANSQNGQYMGTGGQGSWGKGWGEAPVAPAKSVAVQALSGSTATQEAPVQDLGQYTWKPSTQTSQLQTTLQSLATSALSQSTWSQATTTSQTTSSITSQTTNSITSLVSSTTSQSTATTSHATTTHSEATRTSIRPTTLETRVAGKTTAISNEATHTANPSSTSSADHGSRRPDSSGYAAIAVCAVVGAIAAFVIYSLYRKRQRAKADQVKGIRRHYEEPKPGHFGENHSTNTLPQIFLASKSALFSVVSLRSSNEKDDMDDRHDPEHNQMASTSHPQQRRSQRGMDVALNTGQEKKDDGDCISEASTIGGTPSPRQTFRQPTELHHDVASISDSSDDDESVRRPGIYRRLTERVASIRGASRLPASSKQPKDAHHCCCHHHIHQPNEIITESTTSSVHELKRCHESDSDGRSTSDDDTDHRISRQSPRIQQSKESRSDSPGTSDDDTDNSHCQGPDQARESRPESRSVSPANSDHNIAFPRPTLKTRGSFKERVTGLAKLSKKPSINTLYRGSAASSIEDKDRPTVKLTTIPDDELEDNKNVASYAPSTFKIYSVEMEHCPVDDTQVKLGLGQSVQIYQVYDHGWVHCLNRDTGLDGLAPRACLSIWPTSRSPSNKAASDVTLFPTQINTSVTSFNSSRPMSPVTRFYSQRCPSSPAV